MGYLNTAVDETDIISTAGDDIPGGAIGPTVDPIIDPIDEADNPGDPGGDYIPPDPVVVPIEGGDTTDPINPTIEELYPSGGTGTGGDGNVGDVVAADPGTVPDPTGATVTESDQSVSDIDTVGADGSTDRIGGILDQGAGIDASQTDLTDEQRVDAELARILGEDSPLLAQARAEAARYANSRGLQNSSMAAGMTYDAMIKAAMPMAQAERSTGLSA